eukprot:1830297-Pyramimonas_sp.AAC.1
MHSCTFRAYSVKAHHIQHAARATASTRSVKGAASSQCDPKQGASWSASMRDRRAACSTFGYTALESSPSASRCIARAGENPDNQCPPVVDIKPEESTSSPSPWWVIYLNHALQRNAAATLVAFVIVDISTALMIWGLMLAFHAPVDPEFALAYAVAKVRNVYSLTSDPTRWVPQQ